MKWHNASLFTQCEYLSYSHFTQTQEFGPFRSVPSAAESPAVQPDTGKATSQFLHSTVEHFKFGRSQGSEKSFFKGISHNQLCLGLSCIYTITEALKLLTPYAFLDFVLYSEPQRSEEWKRNCRSYWFLSKYLLMQRTHYGKWVQNAINTLYNR